MNILQLQKKLELLGVPKSWYAINEHLKSDTCFLNEVYGKWEYFYFDERGNKREFKSFNKEDEACEFFLKTLEKLMKY